MLTSDSRSSRLNIDEQLEVPNGNVGCTCGVNMVPIDNLEFQIKARSMWISTLIMILLSERL